MTIDDLKFCESLSAEELRRAFPKKRCRQCNRYALEAGVTCGRSECQELEFYDNRERAKVRGRRAR